MNKKYEQFFYRKKELYSLGDGNYKVERIGNIPPKRLYCFIKRLFDIVLSVFGIVVAFIPMVIISIVIKCDSQGPIIFKQERLGYRAKPFNIYKFRSMKTNAEENGAKWAEKNDNRVTRVGKFLRQSRLDELPQLFNIFLGQMSFVGPRPERDVFYNEFKSYIDGFDQRMLIIPGLTGFAQINGGYDLLPEEKIIFDIEYIKKRSISMDLKLILETILVVFTHNGAR
jgi:lipopolysaccharide/colanic/teichoic acid biosynthesis glycosyltransferase